MQNLAEKWAGPRLLVLNLGLVSVLLLTLLVAAAPGANAQSDTDRDCFVIGVEMTLAEARAFEERCADTGVRLNGNGCVGINQVTRDIEISGGYPSLPEDAIVTVSVVGEASSCRLVLCDVGAEEERVEIARLIAEACTITADECGAVERLVLFDEGGAADAIVTVEIVEIACTTATNSNEGDLEPHTTPIPAQPAPTATPAAAIVVAAATSVPAITSVTPGLATPASATGPSLVVAPVSTSTPSTFGFGSTVATHKALAVGFTG